jgi:hypothetical protein
MLASITPLGERGRGARWGITVVAFVGGSTGGGVGVGAAGGTLGWVIGMGVSPVNRLWIMVAALVVAVLLDLRIVPIRLPGPRRQVNEQWLQRYRGWVYGIGFGAQLGVGVATIVSTSAVYATLVAAVLAGSPPRGALIGAAFGAVRGLAVLPARVVTDPAGLVRLDAGLRRWERSVRVAAAASLVAFAVVASVGGLGGTA